MLTKICGIFFEYFLYSLPDISKWNTNNATCMNGMFFECYILISLHGISKWITYNDTNMSYMFVGCLSLCSFPLYIKMEYK
jgi:surface protein